MGTFTIQAESPRALQRKMQKALRLLGLDPKAKHSLDDVRTRYTAQVKLHSDHLAGLTPEAPDGASLDDLRAAKDWLNKNMEAING